MARLALIASVAAVALAPVGAARAEGWHSAQPPPPQGSAVGAPVPLGHIGQISFWAPNRGLLITAGTKVVPAGLYYYNGVSWRELSTVCGGANGRIAWAGPDDFWTISDMQSGQESGGGGSSEANGRDRSLCHFENGQVVASYAEPIGLATSYQQMYAAACSGPDDCWFGGETLPTGLNSGAFHLHWNGRAVTPLPSLEQVEAAIEDPTPPVESMVFYQGHFYESVEGVGPGESSEHPFLIHKVVEGSSKPFVPMILKGPSGEQFVYRGGLALQFSASANQLWAAGGSTVMQLNAAGQFQQIELNDPSGVLSERRIVAIAAEPGSGDAWASIEGVGNEPPEAPARVARLDGDGTIEPIDSLPEGGEQLARKGSAEAIACPAAGDCWVATSQGWLFHLGGDQPEDHDQYFQGLITSRPADPSVAFLAPETYPEDNSGSNPPPIPAPPPPARHETEPMVRAPLFSNVKEKLVRQTTLTLSFTLVTKSRVRLVAQRARRPVARTRSLVLGRGRHTLELRLSRRAWPTKLDLQVHALGSVPLIPAGSGSEKGGGHEAIGGPTAVET